MIEIKDLLNRARKQPFNALVESSGLSRSNVFGVLRGANKNPTMNTINALSKGVILLEAKAKQGGINGEE